MQLWWQACKDQCLQSWIQPIPVPADPGEQILDYDVRLGSEKGILRDHGEEMKRSWRRDVVTGVVSHDLWSFQRLPSQPITWLILTKLHITATNNTKNPNNNTRKLLTYEETTAWFRGVSCHPARKQTRPTLQLPATTPSEWVTEGCKSLRAQYCTATIKLIIHKHWHTRHCC